MGSSGVLWKWFAGASGSVLLAAEIGHAYDRSWRTYQALQTTVLLEYVSLALTLAGDACAETPVTRKIWKYVELLAFFAGVFATTLAGRALSTCAMDTHVLDERGDARECIDVYSSYAALTGPYGTDNVCATLSRNIESPMGGTCPTISYSDENAAKAMLGTQFAFIVGLTVLHIWKFSFLQEDEESGESTSNKTDNTPLNVVIESGVDTPASTVSDKGRRAMTSIYYGKGNTRAAKTRAMQPVGSNKFV